jgi:hypothetical protein
VPGTSPMKTGSRVPSEHGAAEARARHEPGISQAQAPLKLVRGAQTRPDDTVATIPEHSKTYEVSADLRVRDEPEHTASVERSYCAFCAAPSQGWETCCEESAATLDEEAELPIPDSEAVRAPVAADGPVRTTASRARFVPGSQFLVGLLVSSVSVLALALTYQSQIADERSRELEATRRLSREMIALMREARRQEAATAVVPQAPTGEAERGAGSISPEPTVPATTVGPATALPPAAELLSQTTPQAPAGEAAARPEAPPPVVAPPAIAAETMSGESDAVTEPDSPAAASPAIERAGPFPPTTQRAASGAPAPASALPAAPVTSPAEAAAIAVSPPPAAPALPATGERAPAAKTTESVAARSEVAKPPRKPSRAVAQEVEARRSPATTAAPGTEVTEIARAPGSAAGTATAAEPALQDLAARSPTMRGTTATRARIVSAWTKLERGMSRQEIRSLLGEPRWIDRLMAGEFWLYAERSIFGRGWVAFSDGGTVIEWSEP